MPSLHSTELMLYKYTITKERFDEAKSQLLLAGFAEDDAKKLIIRKSSANSVSSVLNYCDKLLQPPFNLTKKQIIKIAANAGGGKNILEKMQRMNLDRN